MPAFRPTTQTGYGQDTIYGDLGSTTASVAGNDQINGNAGNDLIYAGTGTNTITKGTGPGTQVFNPGVDARDHLHGNPDPGTKPADHRRGQRRGHAADPGGGYRHLDDAGGRRRVQPGHADHQ